MSSKKYWHCTINGLFENTLYSILEISKQDFQNIYRHSLKPIRSIVKMKPFLRFIRFPNLLIVGLTQYLLRYCILQPFYSKLDLIPILSHFQFFLLVLTTMLIAAGGYVINDIYDYEIDKINKPGQIMLGRVFSVEIAWYIYAALHLAGFILAIYVAWHVGDLRLMWLFPAAALPLWLYSWKLKKMPLIGNIVVATFCAMVTILVLFAERKTFSILFDQHKEYGWYVFYLFWGYAVFAYFSTMFREIVKDIEDVEGDQKQGCRTLPVVLGIKTAKIIAGLFIVALLCTVIYLLNWQWENFHWQWAGFFYTLIFIFIPILLAMLLLVFAQTKQDFHRLSSFTKLIMLTGLLYLPLFSLLFLIFF